MSIDIQSMARYDGSSADALVETGTLTPLPLPTILFSDLGPGTEAFQMMRYWSDRRGLVNAASVTM